MSARGPCTARFDVARTIADLGGEQQISALQLAEALRYRAYEARHRDAG